MNITTSILKNLEHPLVIIVINDDYDHEKIVYQIAGGPEAEDSGQHCAKGQHQDRLQDKHPQANTGTGDGLHFLNDSWYSFTR